MTNVRLFCFKAILGYRFDLMLIVAHADERGVQLKMGACLA
jgi:hypothetical protein